MSKHGHIRIFERISCATKTKEDSTEFQVEKIDRCDEKVIKLIVLFVPFFQEIIRIRDYLTIILITRQEALRKFRWLTIKF